MFSGVQKVPLLMELHMWVSICCLSVNLCMLCEYFKKKGEASTDRKDCSYQI